MFTETFSKSKIISGIGLIAIGVLGRFFLIKFVGIPNFEIITALTLISAVFLGRIWALVVPLSIIAITDAIIGNGSALLFTWSAFAMIGMFGLLFRSVILIGAQQGEVEESRGRIANKNCHPEFISGSRQNRFRNKFGMTVVGMTGIGIVSSIFFFLYTNFGWWLVSSMYPHTWDGLIQCYIMGLPFFKNNLIGNLIFVPMASGMAMYVVALNLKLKSKSEKLQLKIN